MRFRPTLFVAASVALLTMAAHAQPAKTAQTAVANAPNARAYNAAGNIVVHNVYGDAHEGRISVIGKKVAITRAYLLPFDDFAGGIWEKQGIKNGFYDAVGLCVEVANISSAPLLVTALRLDITRPGRMRFGPGHVALGCPSEHVSDVDEQCLLRPGERRRWMLNKGMVLPGVVDFLMHQSDEFLLEYERPRRTNNADIIGRFNEFLRASIGSDTVLDVSVFELNYQPLLKAHFELAQGADMFAHEPSVKHRRGGKTLVFPLQHDFFLGEALSALKAGEAQRMHAACAGD